MKLVKLSVSKMLLIVVLVVSFLVSANTANAASDFDNDLQSISVVKMRNLGVSDHKEYTADWLNAITDTYDYKENWGVGTQGATDFKTKLLNAFPSGRGWFVTQDGFSDDRSDWTMTIGVLNNSADYGALSMNPYGVPQMCWAGGYSYMHIRYDGSYVYSGIGAQGAGGSSCFAYGNRTNADYGSRFLLLNVNMNYPDGYAGALMPTEYTPPVPEYAAMGDSYSSGEGTFDYLDESNHCHRSGKGYVGYVAEHLNLGSPLFLACSGALTSDMFSVSHNNPSEGAQVDELQSNIKKVTLTIGGNDVGFSDIVGRCTVPKGNYGCSEGAGLNADIQARMSALAGGATYNVDTGNGDGTYRPIYSLADVYRAVALGAHGAKIYVGGYPHLFGSDSANYTPSSADSNGVCNMPAVVSVAHRDAQWMNGLADQLDAIIVSAVDAVKNEGVDITYVSAGLFASHGLCDTSDPWLNDVVFTSPDQTGGAEVTQPESLHPTEEGYQNGYGIAFATIMD